MSHANDTSKTTSPAQPAPPKDAKPSVDKKALEVRQAEKDHLLHTKKTVNK